jgi:hypothetical protein
VLNHAATLDHDALDDDDDLPNITTDLDSGRASSSEASAANLDTPCQTDNPSVSKSTTDFSEYFNHNIKLLISVILAIFDYYLFHHSIGQSSHDSTKSNSIHRLPVSNQNETDINYSPITQSSLNGGKHLIMYNFNNFCTLS